MRADIHYGQEHERSIHGPDTEAQDQSPPSLTSGLQHTAGPYSRVISSRCVERPTLPHGRGRQRCHFRSTPKADIRLHRRIRRKRSNLGGFLSLSDRYIIKVERSKLRQLDNVRNDPPSAVRFWNKLTS